MTDWFAVLNATWPPAREWQEAGFTLRDGAGGGKRASAATLASSFADADTDAAEAAMRASGQPPLFMVKSGQHELDSALSARGYQIVDPTNIYAAPVDLLTATLPPPVSAFTIWPPLAIMVELWAAGGIGPGRLAVMERVADPKTGILARINDQPAGVAFAAIHDQTCMIHALDVAKKLRRNGAAGNIMRQAGKWAQDMGARQIALAVTAANAPANTLYCALGLTVVASYHYRAIPTKTTS